MDRRVPAAILLLVLLIVPMCTAFRIPDSVGKAGRVPSVVKGEDELNAVINLQYRAQHQHLIRQMEESGEVVGSDDHDACQRLDGLQLAHCQRLRFERLLTDDYKDAQANVNEVLAPLPA